MSDEKMNQFHQRIADLIAELEHVNELLEDGEPSEAYDELGNQPGTVQTLLNDMRDLL